MWFRRYGTFYGGIDLPDEKYATLDEPIRSRPLPERLLVPLGLCGGKPAELTAGIEKSSRVTSAQKIARATDATSVDIFAPLSGTVSDITTAQVAFGGKFVTCPVVELTDLSDDQLLPDIEPADDWMGVDPQALAERLAEGGLCVGFDRPQPMGAWLDQVRDNRCDTLIANVMENQPYMTAGHRLLAEHGPEVVAGLAILARAGKIDRVILAVDRRRTGSYSSMVESAQRYNITLVALGHKYPIGSDPVLVKVLTRRERPPGASVVSVGAAVVGASTCLDAWRWIACGKPPTHSVVTVDGIGVSDPGNFSLPIGTPCAKLIDGSESRIIHGGPMTGIECTTDAVITASTRAVLALEPAALEVFRPCIRCGWCTDYCPAGLNVATLNDAFEHGVMEQAEREVVPACVECGICSYVCPAKLPLTQRVKQLKNAATDNRRLTGQGE